MAAFYGVRIAWILRVLLVVLILAPFGTCYKRRGLRQHLERFFCSVDQDGDGEIEQHEASKFLTSFRNKLDLGEDSKYDNGGGKDVVHDFNPLHNFRGDFSYGGATISAEEMLDHLQNMLTADRVVDWITHGLQLPQYAEAFRENAVNGLDFPALIEDHSQTLLYELQVQSLLHRKKITHAIVRQVFGYGAVPSPPRNLMCVSASCAVQVQWEAPFFPGYPPLHKYLTERRLDNGSSWIFIGDSKENNFLDRDGIYQGKVYNYRVQAWGDHGPSEWVQIHGCQSSDVPVSDRYSDREILMNTAEITSQIEAFSGGRGISSVDLHGMDVVTESSEGWGWIRMYLFNCFLLVVGIISRHSLFFRFVLSSWVLFKNKLFVPIYTKLIYSEYSEYIQAKIWDLSRQENGASCETFSVNPDLQNRRQYVGEIESINDINEISVSEWGIEDSNIRDSHGDEYFPSAKKGNNLNSEMMQSPEHQNHNIGECMKSTKKFMAVGTTSGGRHSKFTGSASKDFKKHNFPIPNERVDKCNEISLKTMSLGHHRKTNLTKIPSKKRYRCNYEGCKSRFDRWHSASDWQMRFSKHYCRDCQGVFCVRHTRISPHGPFGQCGLDSSCVCQACFEQLPLESKESLEHINKLRVGPCASDDLFSHEKLHLSLEAKESLEQISKLQERLYASDDSLSHEEKQLPLEAKESLEQINKLREGPYPSDDSISHEKKLPLEAKQSLEQINKLGVGPYTSDDSFSHEKKRKWPSLKKVSSHTKVNKLKLSGKNGTHEAQNEHNSQHTGRDPYPPNLGLPYYSDSNDGSLSDKLICRYYRKMIFCPLV